MTKKQKINKLRNESKNYSGVYLDITKVNKNSPKVFRGRVRLNGFVTSCGYHTTAIEAAKAVNKLVKNYYGSEKEAKKAGKWNKI